jgi:hypothetical protein
MELDIRGQKREGKEVEITKRRQEGIHITLLPSLDPLESILYGVQQPSIGL